MRMDPSCLIGPDHDVAQVQCLESLFGRIVGIAASLAAMVFFVMLIVGGFQYLTSAGDPKKAEAAKGTLTAAFIGIVLIVGAYIILRILEGFTGLDLTTFKIVFFP